MRYDSSNKVTVSLTVNKEDGTERTRELELWPGAIGNLAEYLPLGKKWTSAVLTFTNSPELKASNANFGRKVGDEEEGA